MVQKLEDAIAFVERKLERAQTLDEGADWRSFAEESLLDINFMLDLLLGAPTASKMIKRIDKLLIDLEPKANAALERLQENGNNPTHDGDVLLVTVFLKIQKIKEGDKYIPPTSESKEG